MTTLFFQAASKSTLSETIAKFMREIVASLETSGRANYEAHHYGVGGL